MNIVNDNLVMIFKNDSGKYSVGLSKKKENGEYERAYSPIQFKKDIVLENQTKGYIRKAWLSFYNWEHEGKKGTTVYIMCTEFETIEEVQEVAKQVKPTTEQNDPFADFGNEIEINDNFLD